MTARHTGRILTAATAVLATVTAGAAIALAASASAGASTRPSAAAQHFRARVVLDGTKLSHSYIPSGSTTPKTEALSKPDDITVLGHFLFVAFQNGVGPQGEPSSDGNTNSTVVQFTGSGHVVRQWDLHGKCDGLTAGRGVLFATVNEDANSSIYTISPGAKPGAQITHFHYNRSPLPHNGGTDAISIYHGMVLVSASAPGTLGKKPAPQPTFPAVYVVRFVPVGHVAVIRPLFFDEAPATVANVGTSAGKRVRLALTDPDSNEVVPRNAPRFAGDFMLTSQGDKEQIFLSRHGRQSSHLAVLRLSNSVDDTAWIRSPFGRIYASNTGGDTVDVVTGPFRPGTIFAAVTPCDASNAPATCPGPGFPPNYLGQLNPWTGHLTRVPLAGAVLEPQGMVFVGPNWNVVPG